jgi:hypothetical protein
MPGTQNYSAINRVLFKHKQLILVALHSKQQPGLELTVLLQAHHNRIYPEVC